ncbi:hypothetical protein C0J52_28487 [Blattella germanica]|nr:hypothetical protein C0J52_28487 [Blattella germanica]
MCISKLYYSSPQVMSGDSELYCCPVQYNLEELSKDLQGQLLLSLIRKEKDEFVKLLNNEEVDVNHWYPKPFFSTCLQFACKHEGYHLYVEILLNSRKVGPNINSVHPEPIHIASKNGNMEVLRVLLENKKTKINAVDADGRTALHHAVKGYEKARDQDSKKNIIKCIELLMGRRDFNVNNRNYKGFTAIHEAANYGDERLVRAMMNIRKHDLDIDSHRSGGNTAREVIEDKFPTLKLQLPEGGPKDIKTKIQYTLLKTLEARDIKKFVTILSTVAASGNSKVDPNYWYSHCQCTCLEKAIKYPDCIEFVKALLLANADPNFINPSTEQAPVHLAVYLHNVEALQILLSIKPPIDINIQSNHSKTPLHIAVEENLPDCVEMILERSDVDVNLRDAYDNTALYIATKNKNRPVVQNILEYMNNREKHIRRKDKELIMKTFPILTTPEQLLDTRDDLPEHQSVLFQYLFKEDSKKFCQTFKNEIEKGKNHANSNNGRNTFLQCAVEKNMVDAVKLLLKYGADPNHSQTGNPPFIIATKSKFYEIMKLFLQLPKEKFQINVRDVKGDTALHWAANNCELLHVVELLHHGADATIKNLYNKSPFDGKNLENLLNLSIKREGYPQAENYKLVFDLSLILALRKSSEEIQKSEDEDDGIGEFILNMFDGTTTNDTHLTNDTSPNSVALDIHDATIDVDQGNCVSEQNEDRKNAHEEIITEKTPLSSEGERSESNPNVVIKQNQSMCVNYEPPRFNKNSKQKTSSSKAVQKKKADKPELETRKKDTLLAAVSNNNTYVTEMDFLYEMSKIYRDKINHPLIRCFVFFKWNRLSNLHYINLLITSIFVISLNLHILKVFEGQYMVGIFLSLLIVREIIQFVTSLKRYVYDFGNLFEHFFDWSLIIMSVLILCKTTFPGFMPLVILLSWLQFIIVSSRLSCLALKFEMLKRVSTNYFQYLLSYVCILLAFVLCFHSMYLESGYYNIAGRKIEEKNQTQKDKLPFFNNIWLGFVGTTMLMMNNEVDMLNEEFPDFFEHTIYTSIYLLFIFFTMIVLFNLLTGLAVSDTKAIMDSSKQLRILSQIKQLYEIESILFKLYRLIVVVSGYFNMRCPSNFFRKYFKSLLLFQNPQERKCLVIIYPNRNGEIRINNARMENLKMDKEILGDTNDIVSDRESVMENDEVKERIDKIETIVNQLQDLSNCFDVKNVSAILSEIHDRECEIKRMLQQVLHATQRHKEL